MDLGIFQILVILRLQKLFFTINLLTERERKMFCRQLFLKTSRKISAGQELEILE